MEHSLKKLLVIVALGAAAASPAFARSELNGHHQRFARPELDGQQQSSPRDASVLFRISAWSKSPQHPPPLPGLYSFAGKLFAEAFRSLALEARERQQVAPPAEPGIDHDAIEHRVAQQTVDRFAAMLRKEYWTLPELRRQHREAIAAATLDFGLRRRRPPH
jgi:hypothetical protein